MTIAYDGTNFHGWQRQPEARTVQKELERVLSAVCNTTITIDGTSRTDAGVHAYGQCATFSGEFGIPVDRIMVAANNYLSGSKNQQTGDIRITSIKEVAEGFHARFDSKGKKYVYKLTAGCEPEVFKKNYYYQLKENLDVQAMREAAKHIVGTHDFKCFQASGGEEKETTVRTVRSLEILSSEACEGEKKYQKIDIEIAGDGFLYNMVRIITGTLVEVGLGKRTPESVKTIIKSMDRTKAGHTAPPQGLYLVEVYYE